MTSLLQNPRYAPDLIEVDRITTGTDAVEAGLAESIKDRLTQCALTSKIVDPREQLNDVAECYFEIRDAKIEDPKLLAQALAELCRVFSALDQPEKAFRAAEAACNVLYEKGGRAGTEWLRMPLYCAHHLALHGNMPLADNICTRVAQEADKHPRLFKIHSLTVSAEIREGAMREGMDRSGGLQSVYMLGLVAEKCTPTFTSLSLRTRMLLMAYQLSMRDMMYNDAGRYLFESDEQVKRTAKFLGDDASKIPKRVLSEYLYQSDFADLCFMSYMLSMGHHEMLPHLVEQSKALLGVNKKYGPELVVFTCFTEAFLEAIRGGSDALLHPLLQKGLDEFDRRKSYLKEVEIMEDWRLPSLFLRMETIFTRREDSNSLRVLRNLKQSYERMIGTGVGN